MSDDIQIGIVPKQSVLVHVEVSVTSSGEAVSVCQIERIDGAFNMSVSTVEGYEHHGYASNCVRRCLSWWNENGCDEVLNWWARRDNGASVAIAKNNGFVIIYEDDEWYRFTLGGLRDGDCRDY